MENFPNAACARERLRPLITSLALLVAGAFALQATPPPGYYAAAEGKAGAELRQALHQIIRNHHVIPYSSTSFDTADAVALLDQDPVAHNSVILIYSGSNLPASTFGTITGWNREHLWPQSYGIDGAEPAYSDLFNLRACDATVNSSRGNKFFDTSDSGNPNYRFPAHAEARLSSTDADSWEPPPFERGDIARAIFYLATRYTGDAPNEPALMLTDNLALITSANSYMGRLSTLLAWHAADPVDAIEKLRNDRIYSLFQTNRNPFVDHPEWVNHTYAPPQTNPPTLNISLATAISAVVLTWVATNQSSHLEHRTSLSGLWTPVTNTPTLLGGEFHVLWPALPSHSYFRLRTN